MAGRRFACVKIVGRANFTASLDFNQVLAQLRDRGIRYFVIELSECQLMDSTFLGVLAGFGLKFDPEPGAPRLGCVELRNANARISELLENIGVLHLFESANGPLESPEALEKQAVQCEAASRKELTRTCLRAHETLMALNPDNIARFKDVTKFMAEDLARLEKPPGNN